MNSYIIADADLKLIDKLNRASIDWNEWEGQSVLVSADPKEITQALGATSFQTEDSTWEDIYKITFSYPVLYSTNHSQAARADLDPALARSRDNYIKLTRARLNEVVEAARKALERQRTELQKVQSQYVRSARWHFAREQKGNKEALLEQFKEQYKRLIDMPQIRAVRWNAGEIQIYTTNLRAVSSASQEAFELGKFLIVINGDDSNGVFISCFNQSGTTKTARGNMQAPYVYGDGKLAPHDLLEPMAELVGQMEYATAVELLLQYLENADDDYLGNMVMHWPRARTSSQY